MQKLYSETLGLPIFAESTGTPAGFLRDCIIDPENGKIIALDLGRDRIISVLDVLSFGARIVIPDQDAVVALHDILRVREVVARKIHILGTKVVSEKQKSLLGRVIDFAIDTRALSLSAIHVARNVFFFHFNVRIIPAKEIVRIEQKKIVVKDPRLIAKEKARALSKAFAS